MFEVINDLSGTELVELRNSVGWKELSLKSLENGLKSTKYKVKILYNGIVAGCGRIVSDNYTMGVLNNIIVKPEYQGKGIGKKIITSLFEMVNNDLSVGDRFQIEATPTSGNREFYIKCGMKYKPENQDGVYIWLEKGIHKMRLVPFAFEAMKSGKKDIEIRLNDEKRQLIKIGDYIDFTNTETGEKLTAKVKGLYTFDSFKELFSNLDNSRFGLNENDTYEIVNQFYSDEEQHMYKALAIEVEKV